MIVIVFGLPGTGKSYLASRLATRIKAEYVGSDQVRFSMIKYRTYDKDEKMRVYGEMLKMTEQLTVRKKHVVLDATFYQDEIRKMFISLAKSLRVKIYFIEVTAAQPLVKKRVIKKRESSEAGYAVYLKIKESFEPMNEKHLILQSTDNNIEDMLERAIRYLS